METERIEFHIASHDYFGTLATILDLLRQDMKARGYSEKDAQLLERLTDELLYVQANHIIH